MEIRRLAVEDFRSYARADIELTRGITALVGANGSGKTNLLEAAHLLARGDSGRTHDDREMVRWGASVAHARAEVARGEDDRTVEVVLFGAVPGERRRGRRWLVDGAGKRADDAIGELVVVAFFPEEVALLAEAPSARRRYLDAMVGQIDRHHRADMREYQRILEHRNALLRALREGRAPASEARGSMELAFWNEGLCRTAGRIAHRRTTAVEEMRAAFREAAATLGGGHALSVTYAGQAAGDGPEALASSYLRLIEEKGEREVWQGATLVGPHREDLAVTADGRALPSFASRGEHRSAVLALKLAEAGWIRERTGEIPVFLLDDVLSELDPRRREALIEALPPSAQVIVTAAFPAGLPAGLLQCADVRQVSPGAVS